MLKGIQNLKEDKAEVNLVKVNFSANSYNRLLQHEKDSLSETAIEFLHFLESFAQYENQYLIHLWLLEDNIQDINTNTCGPFQIYFYKNVFFQDSDSILHERKRLTYDVVQEFLKELFTTNTDENEKITSTLNKKNIKIENQ